MFESIVKVYSLEDWEYRSRVYQRRMGVVYEIIVGKIGSIV